MTLRIYPIVLQLVRRLSPYLPLLRARSASLGDQLEPLSSAFLSVSQRGHTVGARTVRHATNQRPLRRGKPWLVSKRQKRSAGSSRASLSSAPCSNRSSALSCGSARHDDGDVMVRAAEGAALEVVEPEFTFEVLVHALLSPALFDGANEFLVAHPTRNVVR